MIKKMKTLGLAIALITFVFESIVLSENLKSPLEFSSGWIRLMPPVSKNTAGYFTIKNTVNRPIVIVSVTTSASESAALHDVVEENGMVKMKHLPKLTIKSGQEVDFIPSGKHLMLINLHKPLKEGEDVEVKFNLKTGEVITTSFKVMRNLVQDSAHHHH